MQLEILTDDPLGASVCKDYWLQDKDGLFVFKVKEVAFRYGSKPHLVSRYVKKLAYAWSASICCRVCEEPYRFGTRVEYQERKLYAGAICQNCLEAAHKNNEDQKRNTLIKFRQAAEMNTPDTATLDLKSTIYLLAIIHAMSNENLSGIEALKDYPAYTLSPDPVYDEHILQYLFDKHLLLINLGSPLEAVELSADGTTSIRLVMCKFDFSLDLKEMSEFIRDFIHTEVLQNIKKSPEFIELCKEVQLQECLAFLKVKLKEHQFNFSPGEKTMHILRQCLESFSVAQTYSFIWRATREAAAYYMRGHVSKRQAANAVVRYIVRSLEQALANNWDMRAFNRNYELPQSSLSSVIFNTLLGTDDGGFKQPLYELVLDN